MRKKRTPAKSCSYWCRSAQIQGLKQCKCQAIGAQIIVRASRKDCVHIGARSGTPYQNTQSEKGFSLGSHFVWMYYVRMIPDCKLGLLLGLPTLFIITQGELACLPSKSGWLEPSWPEKRAGLLPCNHIIFFKELIIVWHGIPFNELARYPEYPVLGTWPARLL